MKILVDMVTKFLSYAQSFSYKINVDVYGGEFEPDSQEVPIAPSILIDLIEKTPDELNCEPVVISWRSQLAVYLAVETLDVNQKELPDQLLNFINKLNLDDAIRASYRVQIKNARLLMYNKSRAVWQYNILIEEVIN